MKGAVIVSNTSAAKVPASSVPPMKASENIPIISALICFALSLRRDEKTVDHAFATLPSISAIREPMSNMATIYSFIRSLFCCKNRLIPPNRLSAMDAPILATEPAILPRLMARILANRLAACCTSGDVNISVRLSLMPWMDSFMLSRTLVSPKPTLNPAMNRFLSWLALSISPWYLLSISSTAEVSSSPMSNSSAEYPPPAPPPEPPPLESVSGLMMLSSSMPVVMLFMSLAAFLAAPPAAAPALSADWAIASIPAVAADAPPPPFFPVTISVNALKALARLISLLMMRLITWMIGVSTLMSPCPIVALRLSNCSFRTRTWFAQPSAVRMKSPDARDSWSCTNLYRSATFSASDIFAVTLP